MFEKNIEFKSRIECDEKLQKSKHYPLILEVEKLIFERFPYGAINRVDVVQKQKISDNELKNQMRIMVSFSHESNKSSEEISYLKLTNIMQTMLFGECGSLVNYAIGFLKKKYPETNVECIFLDNHAQLLIGRNLKTDPAKIKTWNEDAVIYDIWADQSYFVHQFFSMQSQSKNIPFYLRVVNNDTNEVTRFIIQNTHYLTGTPTVYTGRASQLYDQKLVQYVEEDQKRWKQPECTAPLIPVIGITLDAEKIKTSLMRFSKCDGWKFNSKRNVAWIECNDSNQAERIAKALNASKSMVVTLTKRSDNQIPVVKCEHFNVNKMELLVNALSLEPVNRLDNMHLHLNSYF